MRKIALWAALLALLVTGGCGGAKPNTQNQPPATQQQEPAKPAITQADAEALVVAFLQERVEGRNEAAAGRIVSASRQNPAWQRTPDLVQYQITRSSQMDADWLVETQEYRNAKPTATAVVEKAFYLVVQEGGKPALDLPELRLGDKGSAYKVVATTVQAASSNPTRRLALTEGDKSLGEVEPPLPNLFRPYGANQGVEFGVGKNGWGALALSPDLRQIGFVTRGTHAFLGVVDRGGQLKGLDLWFEGGPGELLWSLDGKYLAATNASARGIYVLQLWNPGEGTPVKLSGLPDDRDISHLQWREGKLYVQAGTERWVVDPATGKATKAGS